MPGAKHTGSELKSLWAAILQGEPGIQYPQGEGASESSTVPTAFTPSQSPRCLKAQAVGKVQFLQENPVP